MYQTHCSCGWTEVIVHQLSVAEALGIAHEAVEDLAATPRTYRRHDTWVQAVIDVTEDPQG